MKIYYAKVIAPTGRAELPIGTIAPIETFERQYVPGFGLEQQVVGVRVLVPGGQQVELSARCFVYATDREAKHYRDEQKHLRSTVRRGSSG